jgi:hypothetical protein
VISCKRAGELLSRSLETPLGFWPRVLLYAHLAVCGFCRRLRRQFRLMQSASRRLSEKENEDVRLSDAARERIRGRIQSPPE